MPPSDSVLHRPPCQCGSGTEYRACCGPLHFGATLATGPEQLMRSRYTAYVVGDSDYLMRTWHPRTRPDSVAPVPARTWTGLTVLGSGDDWVEFVAGWTDGSTHGSMQEHSRFEQRGGRWLYVDGDVS